jgi:integrase
MAVSRTPGGRWKAVLKSGREYVKARNFDTKREASDWLASERLRLRGGLDARGGRERVSAHLDAWLVSREGVVAPRTVTADRQVERLLPRWFAALEIGSVTEGHVERLLGEWATRPTLGHASVVRLRASLSAFFDASRRARVVPVNPVKGASIPRRVEPPTEMRPFTEAEVGSVVEAVHERNERLAGVVLVAAWTGLRWGELRALRVCDFSEFRHPVLTVQRSHSEGQAVKGTKSGRARRVPVADCLLETLRDMATGKSPEDLLVTTERGAQLHRTAFIRATHWETLGRGRRLHDLRHTAACLWLAKGVDLGTVQGWLGHADIATTNRYVHYLGTSAEEAGLALLNAPGATRGHLSHGGTA